MSSSSTLFVVESALCRIDYQPIIRFISSYPGGTVLSDEPTMATFLTRRCDHPGHVFVAPYQDFSEITSNIDEIYAVNEAAFTAVSRAYRANPASYDLELEKLRAPFMDQLHRPVAMLHAMSEHLQTTFDAAVFICDPERLGTFPFTRDVARLRAKPVYYTLLDGKLRRYHAFGRRTGAAPPPKPARVASPEPRLRLPMVSVNLFGLRFSSVRARTQTPTREKPRSPFDAFRPDAGQRAGLAAGLFQHVSALLEAPPQSPALLVYGETQSRPYAETLAITLEHAPADQPIIILSPFRSGAESRFFLNAMAQTARRRLAASAAKHDNAAAAQGAANPARDAPAQPPPPAPRTPPRIAPPAESDATPADADPFAQRLLRLRQSVGRDVVAVATAAHPAAAAPAPFEPAPDDRPFPKAELDLIRRALPNVSYYYLDYNNSYYYSINDVEFDDYYEKELDFVLDVLVQHMGARYSGVAFFRDELRKALRAGLRHAFYCDAAGKAVFDACGKNLAGIATFSGRVAEARVAAVEARRREIPLTDWQCTILGKTPVLLPVIAHRVLAIFQNAVDLYVSYFKIPRERVHIVGFPRFLRRLQSLSLPEVDATLTDAGFDPQQPFHVFAAQPILLEWQKRIFQQLAQAADALGHPILICAHPSQRATGEVKFIAQCLKEIGSPRLVYHDSFEATSLFVRARSVIAYSSTFLFEAAYFGRAAIVFDPLPDVPHILDYKEAADVDHATDADGLAAAMKRAEDRFVPMADLDFAELERAACASVWRLIAEARV